MKLSRALFILFFLGSMNFSFAQSKEMTPDVYDIWNRIQNTQISSNGNWIAYNLTPGKGDKVLKLYNTRSGKEFSFERAEKFQFDFNNQFIAFKIVPHYDSIQSLKRKKVKKDKMPKDSLGYFTFKNQSLKKIPDVSSFKMPQEHGSVLAYKKEKRSMKKDSTLVKKEGKNGTQLFVINFNKKIDQQFDYVKDYRWAKKANQLLVHSSGVDSIQKNKIILYNADSNDSKSIIEEKGKYHKLTISQDGNIIAFLVDRDTSKNHVRPNELMLWKKGNNKPKSIAHNDSSFLPENWQISPFGKIEFNEKGDHLFFGIGPIPVEVDSTITDDEKVNLEIWNYKEGLLSTQQNVRLKKEKERSYSVVFDINSNKLLSIANKNAPSSSYSLKQQGENFLSYSDLPYQQTISWEGAAKKDVFISNVKTGLSQQILSGISGNPEMSPAGKFVYWYSRPDTAWMTFNIKSRVTNKITQSGFYDEINDRPMDPMPSGQMSWSQNDDFLFLYDHFDVWKVDPNASSTSANLTDGRRKNIRYRYISLDKELEFLPSDTSVLLKSFDNVSKESGYSLLNLKTKKITEIESGPYNYTTRVLKAKNSDDVIFTKSNFDLFPDLILTNTKFENQKTISNANPQREDYEWGSIELVTWKHPDGEMSEGLLAKPPNFNPAKKYPMIVNFYERSSHRLYSNRDPFANRSTINYSYWTNKGYVIFNPDVRYKNGYPGKSCEEAVVSGTNFIIEKGFVDKDRIGLQGHSWGGYQIAHLLTKTDMYKCAEAGAPVVNMVSAYGGIRWGSGMSRMFQYERTQSRLGATLWERPDLYLENSPIFNIDKVNTPVLILHNDKDGAVPWYQGIEYFVALRRLGKPTWLLNYNEEPHWPVKRQNIIDFNKRMEQFFDHYLLGKPMPVWMDSGIPAVERAYNDGFELIEKP